MSEIIKIDKLLLGDILLYEGTGIGSKLISKYDGSDYSHSAIYVGNKEVIEAVTGGVQKRTLKKSYGRHHSKITVLRLKDGPDDMQPVIDIAKAYAENGNGFAQTQIIMLGLIMITHEHRLNEASALFIDNILQNAAVELFNFTKKNKEPFICSELVYRSYTEAATAIDERYRINITESSTAPLSENPNNSVVSKIYNVELESFNSNSYTSPIIEKQNVVTSEFDKQLDEDLEHKLELLDSQITTDSDEINSETANGIKKSMDQFLSAFYFGKKKDSEFVTPENANEILDSYLRDKANFVSPGDLYRSTSFDILGDLDVTDIIDD